MVIEPYAEAPGGYRSVQYFDKSRMEDYSWSGALPPWDVSNGLLAKELMTGQMQVGDNQFEQRSIAQVNVAGDANDPTGPTYASFTNTVNLPAQPVGTLLAQRIDRSGLIANDPSLAGQGITIGMVDEVTNHGIAGPFWDFMNSSGTVYESGQYVYDTMFENPYFATGRPITEPYWANVVLAGTPQLVLIQCFERRCLTFTPANDLQWQVEMGNIGQHYYIWRYPAQ